MLIEVCFSLIDKKEFGGFMRLTECSLLLPVALQLFCAAFYSALSVVCCARRMKEEGGGKKGGVIM